MTTDAERPLRVVVADDSYLVREALAHLLATTPELELVATCEDGDALLAAVEAELPDVVLTDIRMPPSGDDEGIAVANRLRETHPEIGVVVLSQYADPRYGLALLERGSDGRAYLLKERAPRPRASSSRRSSAVAEGGSVVDPKVVEALIAARMRARARRRSAELTAARARDPRARSRRARATRRSPSSSSSPSAPSRSTSTRSSSSSGCRSAEDVSRRVKAALIYLAHQGDGSG